MKNTINKFFNLSKAFLFLSTIFIYLFYLGYSTQRKDHEGNISMRLQGACAALIQKDLGRHATPFDITPTKENVNIGTTSSFTIYNDLIALTIEGRSMIYFDDYAPQEITCRASILYNMKNIPLTENTRVEFYISPPSYLPSGYYSFLEANTSFTLTIKEIEKISPISKVFPLNKPSFSILDTVLNKLLQP